LTLTSDITATTQLIQSRHNEIKENVFHLRWHQLYKTLEKMYPYFSSYEKEIVYDLMKYLEKLGLRDFSGISLPDESLSSVFSLPNPIFYNDGKFIAEKNTYFDRLGNLNIKIDNNIFYRGSQHE